MSSSFQFKLESGYRPMGDQPRAIKELTQGLEDGLSHQTLLGVTGSGKTYTMANVIAQSNRPSIIMAPNKTLAAQLYGEFKQFFPNNAVEYFVSYYDYYQPEAYVAASDTYIEKDSAINDHIEQLRLSATKAVLERNDTIVVASVSAIYGLGSPETYHQMILHLRVGDKLDEATLRRKLSNMQYTRGTHGLDRGQFRIRGEHVDIFPADSEKDAIRIECLDDEIEGLYTLDPITGKRIQSIPITTIYPKSHYVTPKGQIRKAVEKIKVELKERLAFFRSENKLVEAQRLEERTMHDLELLSEVGFCKGIEHYSRYLSGRGIGEAPPTFFDYLPKDSIVFVDESHVTIPQIGAMHKSDRARKESLVNYGFRLPSALDNRPLQFQEWEALCPQIIMVSATPSTYEAEHSSHYSQQLVRPTSIVDPQIDIRPSEGNIDDVMEVVRSETQKDNRVLVTVLTRKFAEDLARFLQEHHIKVAYIHADVDTVERMEIIRALRSGDYDVLIGINLLREGLDIPEVSTVCIVDADKEGFLRSTRSLIQTIGRAARHIHGRAILYADKITPAMQTAIDETDRRREHQQSYNREHGLAPKEVARSIDDTLQGQKYLEKKGIPSAINHQFLEDGKKQAKENFAKKVKAMSFEARIELVKTLREAMLQKASVLDFEGAAAIKKEIQALSSIVD